MRHWDQPFLELPRGVEVGYLLRYLISVTSVFLVWALLLFCFRSGFFEVGVVFFGTLLAVLYSHVNIYCLNIALAAVILLLLLLLFWGEGL